MIFILLDTVIHVSSRTSPAIATSATYRWEGENPVSIKRDFHTLPGGMRSPSRPHGGPQEGS